MVDETDRDADLRVTAREISATLSIATESVLAAIRLFDEGNTLPFIARYRKEVTRGLDEVQLRQIEDLLTKAREFAQRKATVLESIERQGQLTDALRRQIAACTDRQHLEDLYLPFKPKRRTRAAVARERGLEPLAAILLQQERLTKPREALLKEFVNSAKEVPDTAAALAGACDIVAETWAEDATARSWLRQQALDSGAITSTVKRGKSEAGADQFSQYFEYREPVKRIPSHRFLALQRGADEGVLRVELKLDEATVQRHLESRFIRQPQFPFATELRATVRDCLERLLQPATESAVLEELKNRADQEAIDVFGKNLRELLLAPPAGAKVTLGIDPGFRTGCKLAVVDSTGKFLHAETIYPTPPRSDTVGAAATVKRLIERFGVELIAIGNGTASRETDAFIDGVLKDSNREITKALVSEAGASIYSASELAGQEYPELDLTIRGAISIAHRLQDPLAELVKIDAKSIGVGQYQHDVNQTALRKRLDREVESCVNSVGVDVNMASAPLLSYVAGIGPSLARNIVAYRDKNGRFETRTELLKVPKLGKKAYQQAAGFLRVPQGRNPLDASAVHPESYPLVERMAKQLQVSTPELMGDAALVSKVPAGEFVTEQFGLPTITDILAELAKPGRDPRKEFRTARFSEGVHELEDLRVGMVLEGVITNVTHFGAFVDIGVHQDGLIHISQLSQTFVKDPADIVSLGDIVRVKVLEVDLPRRRIAVSMKEV